MIFGRLHGLCIRCLWVKYCPEVLGFDPQPSDSQPDAVTTRRRQPGIVKKAFYLLPQAIKPSEARLEKSIHSKFPAHVKGISRENFLSVPLSPQTPLLVLKLESWYFAYRQLEPLP